MYKRALLRIQKKIKEGHYVIRTHAYREMRKDGFFEEDMVEGIVSGHIVSRQQDAQTREWKYVIHGNSTQYGKKIGTVVKEKSHVVVITIFQEF